jgi:LmbE family N-acetylglucosaminyl deacetylase
VVSFDEGGVSGHPNHRACSDGLQRLRRRLQAEEGGDDAMKSTSSRRRSGSQSRKRSSSGSADPRLYDPIEAVEDPYPSPDRCT